MVHYTQQTPPADLRAWIRLVWTLSIDTSAPGDPEPVIPDGCPEMIFNLGDPFQHRSAGSDEFRVQPACIVNGQLRSAVALRSLGVVKLVGIRLQPWALGSVAGVPANLLTDNWLSLETVSSQMMPDLRDHLLSMSETENVVAVVAHHFRLMIARRREPDSRLRQIVRHVGGSSITASATQIGTAMGLSERTLQRMFATEVGLSAKQFGKVLRVQQAVRIRQSGDSHTWGRAAVEVGYYDQSHFNKDFRAVVGCAPTELIVEAESFTEAFMSDLQGGV